MKKEYDPELEIAGEVENFPEAEPSNEADALGMTPAQYEDYRKQQTILYLNALTELAGKYDDRTYTDQNGLTRVNPKSERWSSYENPMQEMIGRDDVLSGRYFESGDKRVPESPIEDPTYQDPIDARKELYKYLIDQYDRMKWEERPRRVKNIEEGGSGVDLGEALPYTPYHLGEGIWAGAAHPGQINPNFDEDAASYFYLNNGVYSSVPQESDTRYSDEYEKWKRQY